MHDEIEVARSHIAIGGVVALLVLMAGGEGETEPAVARGRRGARAPDRAHRRTGPEPVPVDAARPQAFRLGVYGMRQLRGRPLDALGGDAGKSLVLRDLPLDLDRRRRHAALL